MFMEEGGGDFFQNSRFISSTPHCGLCRNWINIRNISWATRDKHTLQTNLSINYRKFYFISKLRDLNFLVKHVVYYYLWKDRYLKNYFTFVIKAYCAAYKLSSNALLCEIRSLKKIRNVRCNQIHYSQSVPLI